MSQSMITLLVVVVIACNVLCILSLFAADYLDSKGAKLSCIVLAWLTFAGQLCALSIAGIQYWIDKQLTSIDVVMIVGFLYLELWGLKGMIGASAEILDLE